jgi:hypothetical protein
MILIKKFNACLYRHGVGHDNEEISASWEIVPILFLKSGQQRWISLRQIILR